MRGMIIKEPIWYEENHNKYEYGRCECQVYKDSINIGNNCYQCGCRIRKVCNKCCIVPIDLGGTCSECLKIPPSVSQSVTCTDNGCLLWNGVPFYLNKFKNSNVLSSEIVLAYAEMRIVRLEKELSDMKSILTELLGRCEFSPDGPEAEEAVKRIKTNLNV